jgi:hypothetical protein
LQAIRKKYPCNLVHDDASLQDILKELAAVDSVRNLRKAQEPKRANAVGEQLILMLLQQMMQQAHDYKEEAMAVQSDSDSSVSTKKSSKSARATPADDAAGP